MFGLGLPRGSLMGNQLTVGSPSYRNYQFGNYDQTQGSSSQQQHEVRIYIHLFQQKLKILNNTVGKRKFIKRMRKFLFIVTDIFE